MAEIQSGENVDVDDAATNGVDPENNNDPGTPEPASPDVAEQFSAFDVEIHKWANEKLGNGFTRESVDFSEISIKQRAIVYHKLEDFMTVNICFDESFDNPGNLPVSWVYLQDFTAESKLTWQIKNGFTSQYLPIKDIKIAAPPVDSGITKLDTVLPKLQPDSFSVENSSQQVFDLKRSVSVAPYSQTRAFTEVRTWQLRECRFYCDFIISGFVKIVGHRKRKNWYQQEVKAGIEDFFINKEGYDVIKTFGEDPEVVYKMLGTCSGDLVAGVKVHVKELETAV